MNRERRKRIQQIITQLNTCSGDLSSVKDDEDYARDNTPENLQGGEAYCISEECSDKIDDALSDIQQAVSTLEEI